MLRQLNVRNVFKYSQCCYSTANVSTAAAKSANSDEKKEDTNISVPPKEQSKLIATAFASLKEISFKSRRRTPSEVEQQIYMAQDVDTLLSVVDNNIVMRSEALKIVSILAEWANQGKIKLTDFEMDLRFAKLCKLLGRNKNLSMSEDMADLSVVLGVTADEHAAKLVSSINLQQMINILSSLGAKKRRSLPLLRSLAFNIGRCTETLTVKQASDIFYNIAVLNYPDEVLLEKVCSDIRDGLNDIRKSSIVWSLITSFGILRYKDTDLLENFHTWVIANQTICKTKDFLSLLITSANVNYLSPHFDKFFEIMKPWLKENEMAEISAWVDVVWSLAVLNKIDENTLNSVLDPTFINRISSKKSCQGEDGKMIVPLKLKLLNINGVAKLMGKTYKGSLLDENSDIYKTLLTRPKEKQMLLDSVLESISNFVKIDECLQLDVDSGMGFLIDAVCYLDAKGKIVDSNAEPSEKNKKIAIMINTYHDFCRGCHYELTGLVALTHRLLNDSGYKVVTIPYTEYDLRDKLVNRVQYLNQRLKEAAS